MLFNSFEFLLFLPITFLLYWFVCDKRFFQNCIIVIASYVFYGWWDWRFLLLIAFTSFCSYLSGLLIEYYNKSRSYQKIVTAVNIVISLGLLCIFKYYNFFVSNLIIALGTIGFNIDWGTMNIILPVGISFYTFQALSYTIDVYQKKIKATHDSIEFFAYISFFPQLVAGPIERATNLLPQFQTDRTFDYTKAVDGCRQMLWGFFKKMVVADNCAVIVNQIWNNYEDKTGLTLLVGAILFTFQIYCDFSGYSDIAIGCARLFGFNLKRNFDFPYFSRSIPEFWRRWHISLTTWFRDYIYFPMGGSRCGKGKTIKNVFIVWAISGLWHGANWTFVCWGLFHGTILAVYNIFGFNTKYKNVVAHKKNIPNLKELLQILLTFSLAVIGWIIFRAESMYQASQYMYGLFDKSIFEFSRSITELKGSHLTTTVFFIIIMICAEWCQRDRQHALQFSATNIIGRNTLIRNAVYYCLIMITIIFSGKQSEFIYFQF